MKRLFPAPLGPMTASCSPFSKMKFTGFRSRFRGFSASLLSSLIRYSIVCRLAGLYMFYMIRPSICKDNAFAEMSPGDIVIFLDDLRRIEPQI